MHCIELVNSCFNVERLCVISEKLLCPSIVRCKSRHIKFCDIWTGQYCTFAKAKDTGDVYAWGLNNYYQLGEIPL